MVEEQTPFDIQLKRIPYSSLDKGFMALLNDPSVPVEDRLSSYPNLGMKAKTTMIYDSIISSRKSDLLQIDQIGGHTIFDDELTRISDINRKILNAMGLKHYTDAIYHADKTTFFAQNVQIGV